MSKKKDNIVHIIGDNIYDMAIAYEFNGKNYVKLDFFLAKINEKDKLILDLEAKLAKSEHRNEQLVDALNGEVFINYKLPMENAQLKQQLAEKESEYNKLKQCFDKANETCTFDELREIILTGEENSNERVIKMLNEQVEALEQQLAEKDVDLSLARNEINTLKHNLNVSQEHDKVMCEQYFEKCKETNQDKISFCIEHLEKVKEKILSYEEIYYQFLENGAKIPVFCVENFRVRQSIDKQIVELTHQHEDKGE